MNFKTLMTGCAAGCALALAAAPAFADGIYTRPARALAPEPYVPVQTFAGFYIGGSVGAAFGQIDGFNQPYGFASPVLGNDPVFVPMRMPDLNGSNVFGGVQFGYNYQNYGNYLFGIEIDLGGMGKVINDQNVTVMSPFDGRRAEVSLHSNGGFYGDVTGRIGYTFGPALLYAKGGWAWFNPDAKIRLNGIDLSGNEFALGNNNNDNNYLTGWTVGAGFEYALAGPWTVKLEYLHFDFSNDNNNNCCFNALGQADGINNFRFNNRDLTVDTVKVGFNYLFRPEVAPLK